MVDDPAFPTLDDAQLAALDALGTRRSVASGEFLYAETGTAGTVDEFRIGEGGSLSPIGSVTGLPPGLEGTLGWFKLLDAHLEDFVAGRMEAGEIIAQGGGRLWETFQAHDLVCAVFGHGVARALAPMLPGADVLELGTGTGGTTRRMAADLTAANRVVLSDLRQSFLDRVAADLPGVALETAILDINEPPTGLGRFDLIFSTNCVHVAKSLPVTLGWIRRGLKPGGALVLGEGSHYSEVVPSPVSLVLSLFNGWWDVPTSPERPQPGFLLPQHWFAAFEAAGFQNASMERWTDDARTFGGVYWAFA